MAPFAAPPPPVAAGVVIKWNTHSASNPTRVQYGTLTAVNGTRATVRLPDGTLRSYTAAPAEVGALRTMIGKVIAFQIR